MVLLVSAGIPHASCPSAVGWESALPSGQGCLIGFGVGWSRTATENTSDGPETPFGLSSPTSHPAAG